jgi:hypothetical protein
MDSVDFCYFSHKYSFDRNRLSKAVHYNEGLEMTCYSTTPAEYKKKNHYDQHRKE